jgi:hypothetical protein
MESKTKKLKKPPVPFLGILSEKQIEEGAARFRAEVNSKAIRLAANKVKQNSHQYSI